MGAASRIASSTAASFARRRGTDSLGWLANRLHPLGDASAALETVSVLDSFLPSLMPRTSQHQGMAAGLHVLGARIAAGRLNAVHTLIVGAAASTPASLSARAITAAVGHALSLLPEDESETLWRSGARSGGLVVRAAAASGALFDLSRAVRQRPGAHRQSRALLTGVAMTAGGVYWAGRRLSHRKEVIPRWPIDQEAKIPESLAVGMVISWAGTALSKSYSLTDGALRSYLGRQWGKPIVASAANAGIWAFGAVSAYNAAIASIGRANEKVEAAYAQAPTSPLRSGSPESVSHFSELGLQGRRYVTDVVTPAMIDDVLGEPGVEPIRVYVGFNSIPLYGSGRAELALQELERTGAFDRPYLLLVSPTGTGWVDQTVVEAAEFITRGNIATCAVQYGRFPSFLAVQKVGLGRIQFRLLLWGIRQRLMERPPERRPKVLVFGESLGAWTASDVVMAQGIGGFDHYGIDRALWLGLPALAKWSRNGMAQGSNDLVPEGTVGVFDRHEQLAALSDAERDRLRAVILSHENDPIGALRPELMIREPEWLKGEKGRNVPDDMDWLPVNTFWQVMIDAANAMVTVPGEFGSFGHDYRGDTTRFVRDAYHLPTTTEEQTVAIDNALKTLDIERKQRMKITASDDLGEQWSARFAESSFSAGVPLDTGRTKGARWFR